MITPILNIIHANEKENRVEDNIDYGNMIKYEDIEYFIKLLDNFMAKNPSLSIVEQDEYIKTVMKEYYGGKQITYGIDYVAGAAGLNHKEKSLYN